MRAKLLVLLAVSLVVGILSSCATTRDPWPNVTNLKIDDSCFGAVHVRYNPQLAVVINETVYIPSGSDMKTVHVIRTALAPGSPEYLIDYWEGGSCDPTFFVYDATKPTDWENALLNVFGLTMIIPGDGYVYVHGHTNNFFSQFRKFAVTPEHAEEVQQPFYFAGIETKTTTTVKLLAEPGPSVVVSEVGADSPVIILACRKDDWCLVQDALGLVGWYKLEYSPERDAQFRGVFYAGD
jgi:hypothetical protein